LALLIDVTRRDSAQCGIVARFLAGLYNGRDFPFDLTELRGLDADLFEHCLAVLRLDSNPTVEIHKYLPDGEKVFLKMLRDWDLVRRPILPVPSDFYKAELVSIANAPGYRSATLYFLLNNPPAGTPPIEIHINAKDCARLACDLTELHHFAWSPRNGRITPIDIEAGEAKPAWLR
ncbi:MAG: hypothetical protein H7232_07770, partial [Aeromicrobium sp.]|nr:hypothetical protein [Burkholderiales bacterium]